MPIYMTASGLYTVVTTGNTLTRYRRMMKLTSYGSTEAKLEVTVTWENHGTHTYTLTEYLRDWL